jgi:hypothetical protein
MMMFVLAAGLFAVAATATADEPQKTDAAGQNPGEMKVKLIGPHKSDENFEVVSTGSVKVFYMEGWKDVAQKIADKTDACVKSALALISIEPQGACEITLRPVALAQGELAGSMQSTDLNGKITSCPAAVPEGGAANYSADSLEARQNIMSATANMCAMDLLLAQPDAAASNPRWFLDGITGYLRLTIAGELTGNDLAAVKQLYDIQYADKILEHYRDKLMNWTGPTQSDWAYGAGSAQMFIEIEKKFGAEAVKKIGDGFAKAEKADRDSLVKIISDATGADFLDFLAKYEAPKYPQLGVGADLEYKGPGIRVASVMPNTSAATAGFQEDDIIVKVNGKEVNALADVQAIMKELGVGGELKATVKRGDEEVEITATIGEPAFNFPPDPEPPKPEPDKPADKY